MLSGCFLDQFSSNNILDLDYF